MTECREIKPALSHLEAALEATCATLMALQATRGGLRKDETDTVAAQAQLGDAIGALREAIAELRAFHDAEPSLLAFGFVLADGQACRARRRRQLSPRRTA
jgi:hypothetical protein